MDRPVPEKYLRQYGIPPLLSLLFPPHLGKIGRDMVKRQAASGKSSLVQPSSPLVHTACSALDTAAYASGNVKTWTRWFRSHSWVTIAMHWYLEYE